jgi:rod shape determining protein RodA
MTSILRSRQLRDADHLMIAAMLAIAVLGMFTLRTIPGANAQRQTIIFVIGLVFFMAAAYIDYGLLRYAWQPMYWATLAALVIVLVFGEVIFGAKGFISLFGLQFQPSEFAKVVLIVCLAVYCADIGMRIRDGLEFVFCFLSLAFPPIFLVLAGRDLGTTLVLVAIWLGVMYFAGANLWHILAFLVAGMVLTKLIWDSGEIPDYMKRRIMAWLTPERFLTATDEDPMQTGLQYLRARQAIGAGGVWGQGYGRGLLTQTGNVAAQETDMTFSALAEEMGFVFSAGLVLLYGVVIWRGLNTIAQTQHDLGRYIAAGVVSYLAFELVVNVGMNIGLLPITGIPLPLFSRGGSNLITTMIALGLLVNVHLRRRRITFEAAT